MLFPTPVVIVPGENERAAADAELAASLVAESRAVPGVRRSNAGGWHSVPDLALRSSPGYSSLVRYIVDGVQKTFFELASVAGVEDGLAIDWGVQAWAMVMGEGDYTVAHDHCESDFSAVYYLDAGDADPARHPDSGALVLMDPRRGSSHMGGVQLFPTNVTVRPTTGDLVVFPGWLQHYVHAYRGSRPRVAVSANLSVRVRPPA